MKRSVAFYTLAALGTSTVITSAAFADDRPQWYVGLTGGYSYMEDQDISGNTTATSVKLDSGYVAGVSIGYLPSSSLQWLNNMRFEGEVVYHRNDVKSISPSGAEGSGYYATTGYMANAFYDLPTQTPWSPYIGGGIGLAQVNLSGNPAIGNNTSYNNQFAYQGMIGVGYVPPTLPGTQWTLGYRYFGTTSAEFAPASGVGNDITAKYGAQSLEVGANFRF